MSGKTGYMKYFPKETCYPNQQDAMDKIHASLINKEIILFEGACGTGKTLSALAPALNVGKQLQKTVIIATNVHQQMVQFINEASEIKQTNDVKVAVLKGKSTMCPNETDYEECRLKRENTFELLETERELALKKQEMKSAYENYKKSKDPALIALRDALSKELDVAEEKSKELRKRSCNELYEVLRYDGEAFRQWLFSDVRTPEEVNDYAFQKGMCGYELLKRELKHADLLICNFHHVLNSDIFMTVLNWLEKEPQDVIVIFDEAHNIESAARSHSSITITEHTLEKAISEIEANLDIMPDGGIHNLLKMLTSVMQDIYNNRFKFGERERVGRHWYDMRISDPYERNDMVRGKFLKQALEAGFGDEAAIQATLSEASAFGAMLDENYREQYKKGLTGVLKRSHIRYAADFLSSYLVLSNNLNYYPVLNVRRDLNDEIYGRIELFTCIPKNVTEPLFDSVFSAVLMSATLRPFDMVKSTLGIARPTCELSYGTSFPEEKRLTLSVSVPPLFAKTRDDPQTLQALEEVLFDSIEQTEGNVIIFFQSSFEARRYYNKLEKRLNVSVFLDEVGVSSQEIREDFFRMGESGGKAVLVSYIWGTLSEGIDYRDGRGRTVIIVGVGYPALNDRMNAVESAYDHTFGYGAGWEFAVQVPTIRKIRQAMGRVVRSPVDYGVRILLDGRFTTEAPKKFGKFSVFEMFPDDERDEFIDVDPEKVKYSLMNFFQDNSEK
ncbi:MAG: excision repair protein [Methanolobus sp.]|jgi:DNA excision repair protein ERCC-2|uniref:DNA helicase, Rad3 n=1 Tax=Methanolobus tindarius DSM 2278 TaxID=1090322 RepID=W9DQZ2_METTI|nr:MULTISPECIES: ATP-dependent DNA helicase [Methanolobus]ETA67875.1 DNA helicase, Rad3 [Methanolobus tindarius DSM 2278]MDK2832052.1 excision repair protein [Methanolobus sp.]MDK2938012.1 excision repair protein [Methanolobus sp.]